MAVEKGGVAISGENKSKYIPTEAGSYTVTASATGYNSKTSVAVEVRLPIFLLEKFQFNNILQYEYEYDNLNRLTKQTEYNNSGQSISVYTFTYNIVSGDLEELKWENPKNPASNSKTTFTKNGSIITIVKEGIDEVKETIELNAQGRAVKYTQDWKEDSETSIYTLTFTWLNGNVTKEEWEQVWNNGGEVSSDAGETTYTYDDYKTPFYHCTTPKWILWKYQRGHNANNIKTQTLDGGSTYTHDYTYNYDGFPSTRTNGGNLETYIYKKK